MMPKSKCKHCVEGMVLSSTCERVLSNRFCELDVWCEDIRCSQDGCHYYAREKEKKERGAK